MHVMTKIRHVEMSDTAAIGGRASQTGLRVGTGSTGAETSASGRVTSHVRGGCKVKLEANSLVKSEHFDGIVDESSGRAEKLHAATAVLQVSAAASDVPAVGGPAVPIVGKKRKFEDESFVMLVHELISLFPSLRDTMAVSAQVANNGYNFGSNKRVLLLIDALLDMCSASQKEAWDSDFGIDVTSADVAVVLSRAYEFVVKITRFSVIAGKSEKPLALLAMAVVTSVRTLLENLMLQYTAALDGCPVQTTAICVSGGIVVKYDDLVVSFMKKLSCFSTALKKHLGYAKDVDMWRFISDVQMWMCRNGQSGRVPTVREFVYLRKESSRSNGLMGELMDSSLVFAASMHASDFEKMAKSMTGREYLYPLCIDDAYNSLRDSNLISDAASGGYRVDGESEVCRLFHERLGRVFGKEFFKSCLENLTQGDRKHELLVRFLHGVALEAPRVLGAAELTYVMRTLDLRKWVGRFQGGQTTPFDLARELCRVLQTQILIEGSVAFDVLRKGFDVAVDRFNARPVEGINEFVVDMMKTFLFGLVCAGVDAANWKRRFVMPSARFILNELVRRWVCTADYKARQQLAQTYFEKTVYNFSGARGYVRQAVLNGTPCGQGMAYYVFVYTLCAHGFFGGDGVGREPVKLHAFYDFDKSVMRRLHCKSAKLLQQIVCMVFYSHRMKLDCDDWRRGFPETLGHERADLLSFSDGVLDVDGMVGKFRRGECLGIPLFIQQFVSRKWTTREQKGSFSAVVANFFFRYILRWRDNKPEMSKSRSPLDVMLSVCGNGADGPLQRLAEEIDKAAFFHVHMFRREYIKIVHSLYTRNDLADDAVMLGKVQEWGSVGDVLMSRRD